MYNIQDNSILEELTKAQQLLPLGSIWQHYEGIKYRYSIMSLDIDHSTNEIYVRYKPQYLDTNITLTQNINTFLSKVIVNGLEVDKFRCISDNRRKTRQELLIDISKIRNKYKIGDKYLHYRGVEIATILDLYIHPENNLDQIMIAYTTNYEEPITWVHYIDDFEKHILYQEKLVPRFTKIGY